MRTTKTDIVLDNFLAMTPEVPSYSTKTPNYLVAGANPTYYDDTTGIQEEQAAPLAASFNWEQISATLDGNVIAMCAASVDSVDFAIFVMTSTSHVYGIKQSGATSLGYPSGSAQSGLNHADLVSVNGYLYAAYATTSTIYKINNFSSPNWTSFTPSLAFSIYSFMVPFLEYCMLTGTSGTVIKIDSSFNSNTGFTLGNGWQILDALNYNDKYMAVAAVISNYQDYTENYLFLWNGIDDRPNYSMRIPGSMIQMEVIDGNLYVATQLASNKTAIYILNGTKLQLLFTLPYSNIDQGGFGGPIPQDVYPLFNFANVLGMRLSTTADFSYPLFLYKKTPIGQAKSILSSGSKFSRIVTGSDGYVYASAYVSGGPDTIWFYPQTNTSYQSLLYRSQWIPVNNLFAVDVYYDSPPQSGTDAINVTLEGRGENIASGSSTTALTPITPTNFLNQKRTRLDCGAFQGEKVLVQLSTVNAGTWRPIIRKIVLVQH